MNQTGKRNQPHARRRSVLWDGLNRGTAWLYAVITQSVWGRIMTGYRKADDDLEKGRRYPGRLRCTPVSPARMRLVGAMESSFLFRGIRALFHTLFGCPSVFYGLFGLSYGLLSVLLFFVAPFVSGRLLQSTDHLVISAVIALLSIPLSLTSKTMAEAFGASPLFRLIFIRFLGIPEDRFFISRPGIPKIGYYLSILAGLLAAVGTLFMSPLVIPLILGALGILGMIFTYPEAGVVISTVMLPAVWLDQRFMIILVVLILLTWLSYAVKLLLLHRTIRFGLLDRVILVFGLFMLVSNMISADVSSETMWQRVCLLVCLSSYFLIMNLMTTRAYIRRCLVGVGVSVVVVTLLAYLRIVPADGLAWLEGSRAGDAIIAGFHDGMERLSGLWVEHSELYLVLVFPWLYAYLLHTKRLRRKIMGVVFIALDLALILMTDSVSALFCVVGVTVLFLLLLGHRWLSAGLFSLPLVWCGMYWIMDLYPISDGLQTILSRSRLYKSQLADSLWQIVWDHPAGIGAGEEAFVAVYPAYASPDLGAVTDCGNLFFEILLSYGWVGLILSVTILFLCLQKGLTCLGHTVVSKDRAMILGGITSLVGMVVFGSVRSFILSPRVFFTVILVIALCSAYENIIFDESDMRDVEWSSSPQGEDRFYRRGEYISQKE